MTAEGKTLKNRYGWQAKAQWDKPLLTGKVKLVIRLFFGTKRRQDIDNFNKLILDALTGIIWEDDSQIQELKIIKDYDKAEPRIEIEIL
jgi:crossover junction endodeoxyribonuclease RusA